MTEQTNPKVFFDITIGGEPAGRIVMELRADVTPKNCREFSRPLHRREGGQVRLVSLCTTKGQPSTALFPSSCARGEILPVATGPAASPSTG